MIIHRHSDGSEGYEYEPGDVVRFSQEVGGWQSYLQGRTGTVIGPEPYARRHGVNWRIAHLEVARATDWGPIRVPPWFIRPEPITYAAARVVRAS